MTKIDGTETMVPELFENQATGMRYRCWRALVLCLSLSLLLVCLPGCATPNLDPAYQLMPQDAVIILGLDDIVHVGIFPGRTDGETWTGKAGIRNHANVTTEDGFVVIKLDPSPKGICYGVYNMRLKGGGLWSPGWRSPVPTFTAEAGTVTYIGHLGLDAESIDWGLTKLTFNNRNKLDEAKRYMEHKYPQLAPRLQYRPFGFQKRGLW